MAKADAPARDAVIVKYLNEAYGKEKQLETALTAQIALAKRPQLRKGLQDHLKVTKAQSKGLAKRIKELHGKADAGPDLKGPDLAGDAVGVIGNVANRPLALSKGPVQALRGTSGADNELRNVRDCLWNEAEEIAHYEVIEAVAGELGDKDTVKLAKTYRRQEEAMQKLLLRQIAPLAKAVIKDEVPAPERSSGRSGTTKRASASSSGTTKRASASSARKASTASKGSSTAASKASTATKKAGTATKRAAAKPRAKAKSS